MYQEIEDTNLEVIFSEKNNKTGIEPMTKDLEGFPPSLGKTRNEY